MKEETENDGFQEDFLPQQIPFYGLQKGKAAIEREWEREREREREGMRERRVCKERKRNSFSAWKRLSSSNGCSKESLNVRKERGRRGKNESSSKRVNDEKLTGKLKEPKRILSSSSFFRLKVRPRPILTHHQQKKRRREEEALLLFTFSPSGSLSHSGSSLTPCRSPLYSLPNFPSSKTHTCTLRRFPSLS